jgi:glycosyltransferase involved in cell wall biosynthesis
LSLDRALVIDAYIPYPLEVLEMNSGLSPADQTTSHADALLTLNLQFMAGDYFLCASERQRDLWLGLLLAQGRINPETYVDDRALRGLVDVVSFGLPLEPPRHEKPVLRGVHPAVGEDDRVILWGGGIWQWLDPLTLIRATARIAESRSDVRLFFPGARHPDHSGVPDMEMHREAKQLSDDLGLTNRVVIFGDWLPYEDRQNYLLEADVGASLHFDTVEARFAFRTRVLDYMWAGLPILATRGDMLSDFVQEHGLGLVIEPEDIDGAAAALMALLDTPELRQRYQPRFQAAAKQQTWSRVTEPLLRYCRQPRRALDRTRPDRSIYAAWISDLRRASRRSQDAYIASMEERVESLSSQVESAHVQVESMRHHIRFLEEHTKHLDELVSHYRTGVAERILAEVRRRLGKEA